MCGFLPRSFGAWGKLVTSAQGPSDCRHRDTLTQHRHNMPGAVQQHCSRRGETCRKSAQAGRRKAIVFLEPQNTQATYGAIRGTAVASNGTNSADECWCLTATGLIRPGACAAIWEMEALEQQSWGNLLPGMRSGFISPFRTQTASSTFGLL